MRESNSSDPEEEDELEKIGRHTKRNGMER